MNSTSNHKQKLLGKADFEDRFEDLHQDEEVLETLEIKRGSSSAAFINFFKSMFGCGVLSLPHAFQQSGLVAGLLFYFLIGAICTYSMLLILYCKHMLVKKYPNIITFGDLAEVVSGKAAKRFIDFWVVALELMYNTWMTDLWWLSLFGLVVYLVGVMGLSYRDGIVKLHHDAPFQYKNVIWDSLPLFCGTAMYSLEGILAPLPTVASMTNEKDGYAVIAGGMLGITVIFGAFGAFGYAAGLGDCGIILDCLPDDPYTRTVKICLVLSLVVSSPIQVYIASESLIAPESGKGPESGSKRSGWVVYAVRIGCVVITALVAAAVPNFSTFTDLVGTLIQPVLGFLLPPAIFLLIRQKLAGDSAPLLRYDIKSVGNVGLMVLGMLTMVIGMRSTVQKMRSGGS